MSVAPITPLTTVPKTESKRNYSVVPPRSTSVAHPAPKKRDKMSASLVACASVEPYVVCCIGRPRSHSPGRTSPVGRSFWSSLGERTYISPLYFLFVSAVGPLPLLSPWHWVELLSALPWS